jgi:hypothetical protein
MATMVGLLDPVGFGNADILVVVLPASIGVLIAACFVQMRVGEERRRTPSTSGAWLPERSQPSTPGS